MSYSDEDGSSFEGILPAEARSFDINIRFNTAGILPDGVMFLPTAMEDKWAIFLHRDKIIFVRSWLRDVFAIADVVKEPDNLYITRITGSFPEDMQLDDVTAMLRFLLISHVIGETCPAPVSREMAEHPIQAANTAFSLYGRHATIAVFSAYQAQTNTPLRTNTLLHIATAREILMVSANNWLQEFLWIARVLMVWRRCTGRWCRTIPTYSGNCC